MENTAQDRLSYERGRHGERWYLVVPYMLLITYAFMEGSSNLPKIASLMTIPLALLTLFVTGDMNRFSTAFGYLALHVASILFIETLSFLIWIAHFETNAYIVRGSEKVLFLLFNVLVVSSAAYMFRGKAVYYTFWSAVLKYLWTIVNALRRYGISASIASFIEFVKTLGGQSGFMKALEVHQLTYTFGLYILFFALFGKGKKSDALGILAALACFFLGLKRIAVAILLPSILLELWLMKRTQKQAMRVILGGGVCIIAFSYLYIYAIKNGIFAYVMNTLGVDTMSRIKIYDFASQFYEFSVKFIGNGYNYVQKFMLDLKAMGLKLNGVSVVGLHNDILGLYIDMGFWGCMVWLVFTYLYLPHFINKRFGQKHVVLYFSLSFFTYFNCIVSNIIFDYIYCLAWRVIVVASFYMEDNKETLVSAMKEKWRLRKKLRYRTPSQRKAYLKNHAFDVETLWDKKK